MPRASGYFRTDYAQEIALIKTRLERMSLIVLLALLLVFPFVASAFYLDLATQVFLASIGAQAYADVLFAVNYAAFGVVMIGFLIFEPQGLVGIWRRIQNYFLLWPFKQKPIEGANESPPRSRQARGRLSPHHHGGAGHQPDRQRRPDRRDSGH